MSLLRLLTAGKSLIGLKDSAGRYAVTRQRLLPKFNAKHAAASANAVMTGEAGAAPALTGRGAGGTRLATAKPGEANAQKSSPKLFRWWKSKPALPGIPRFQKAMVQGELSLDTVKVVRNDLRDSDLELAPGAPARGRGDGAGRSAAPPQAQGSVPPLPGARPEPAGGDGTWNRMAERFFGVGK